MMDQLIAGFPAQIKEAVGIGQAAQLNASANPIHQVLVTGLGGSGMGANIVIDLVKKRMSVPMLVNKDYHIPAYVNENTLLIASSFSGNTEETLMALEQAIERKAKITCITSGGKMAQIAKEKGLDVILVPGDSPSPRACLGYSFVQQLFILKFHGLIDDFFTTDLLASSDFLTTKEEEIKSAAAALAKNLHDKMPIIYAPDAIGSVAIRWRQQFNENGKMLCWHHIVPEMNHNELVGWRTSDDKLAVLFFRSTSAFSRTSIRMDINQTIIKKYTPHVLDIHAEGEGQLQQMLHLIYLGDWISWYLSEERNMDALEVKVIDYLKGELKKV